MEEELTSEGKCIYCQILVSQKEMAKHIAGHLAKEEKEKKGTKTETYCHIEVESGPMFLHFLVKGSAKMKLIDQYLRDIWLECCGHMSAFQHENSIVVMSDRVEAVFSPKIKILYDYDFGTTTRVSLKALKRYQLAYKENITLLSRNQPLKLLCATCKKKPATCLCSACQWETYSYFCETCAKKHADICEDYKDYSKMPVVNSPRMGECGYTGGIIDLERDGHYQKK